MNRLFCIVLHAEGENRGLPYSVISMSFFSCAFIFILYSKYDFGYIIECKDERCLKRARNADLESVMRNLYTCFNWCLFICSMIMRDFSRSTTV